MLGWLIPIYAAVSLRAGTAIAYVIGAAGVLWFLVAGEGRYLGILPQRVFSQLDSFALMSMPLFILVGEIMNRGGITRALINFSMSVVGRVKGGLGYVNIMTSVFFAGISGSAVADAAALSNTLVPAMRSRGYPLSYAASLTAASSIIGPIIPPSIILIFYGALMQTSVAALFLAGVVPGLLLALALAVANFYYARRDDHPGGADGSDIPPFWPSLKEAAPALSLPAIILAGIVFGLTTPTEAAGLAVLASLVVAACYGNLTREVVLESLQRTVSLTGSIFIILCAVACISYIASLERLPQALAESVASLHLTGIWYMLLLNVVLLIAGTFMEIPVALALIVPLLAPVALAQGADPVHLGLVICFNLSLGLISPPLGGCLAAVSTVTGIPYWELNRAVMPFFFAEVVVLILLIFVPEFSLFLPRLAGLMN